MARSHILYWLWLSLCLSPGSKSSDVLLEHFNESAQRIYEASDDEFDALDIPDEVKNRLKKRDSTEAKKIYYWCREHDVRLLAYDDPAFPARLRSIGRRPVLLYAKGVDVDLNNNLLIAMVGTRRMTSYGKRSAYSIAYDLTRAGAVVVSGLASGVDGVCHRAALDALGKTVALLGCGVDIAYPKDNLDLMLAIEKTGLILSEYKPGTHPSKSTFPTRNRLISGISQGTFVIEGDLNSGAMITANYAKKQGRDLFSLPGMVGEQTSDGTNALLRDGAHPVLSANDILDEYIACYPDKIFVERIPLYKPEIVLTNTLPSKKKAAKEAEDGADQEKEAPAKTTKKQKKAEEPRSNAEAVPEAGGAQRKPRTAPSSLSEKGAKIFEALESADAPLSADQIAGRTDLGISDVMTELTLMEISGVITSLPGNRFIL